VADHGLAILSVLLPESRDQGGASMNVGEAEIAALEGEGQLLVIESKHR